MKEFLDAAQQHFWWIAAGVAGRLMFHGREAQAGRRHFWGRELPFELLIAIGMGLVGNAVCAWLKIAGPDSAGVISAIAYLGPRAIDTLFERTSGAASAMLKKKGE